MTCLGRKPMGTGLVHHLQGSALAKERLETILETVAGRLTVREACDRMGLGEAMFHRLRMRVLQAGLAGLEPRPLGRPPRHPWPEMERVVELEGEVAGLQDELRFSTTRAQIAQVLPHLVQQDPVQQDAELKKTTRPSLRRPNRLRPRRNPVPRPRQQARP